MRLRDSPRLYIRAKRPSGRSIRVTNSLMIRPPARPAPRLSQAVPLRPFQPAQNVEQDFPLFRGDFFKRRRDPGGIVGRHVPVKLPPLVGKRHLEAPPVAGIEPPLDELFPLHAVEKG